MKRFLMVAMALCVGWAFGEDAPKKGAILAEAIDLMIESLPEEMVRQEKFWLDWAAVAEEVGAEEMHSLLRNSARVAELPEEGSISGDTLRRQLAMFPDEPIVLNNLAYFMTTVESNPQGALALLNRIPAAERENATIMDTFAWTYHCAGYKADALQAALRLLELSKEETMPHPLAYDHAGDIFYANELYREADMGWARALVYLQLEEQWSLEELYALFDLDFKKTQRKRVAIRKLHPEAFVRADQP